MTMYIDQKPVVSSKTDHPSNGVIRVKFSDVTLSLGIIEAAWLAANIQREIRTVEREHPELVKPSDLVLSNLKAGDVVRVRDSEGNEADYTVNRAPWFEGPQRFIGLAGLTYGYSLDRVVKVVSFKDIPF
jgi:hypothetical protein